jgi:hypothetical protein
MNTTLKSFTLAAAASMAISAYAGEKEVLDLLVKKGTISAEERGKLLEESKAKSSVAGTDRVYPKQDTTKRLTFAGYFQTQYQSFDYKQTISGVENDVFANQSGFLMRRLYLEVNADAGDGFTGNVVLDMSGNTASSSTSWLDRAIASKTTDWGTFDVGYRKVTWGYEESTLSSLFKASSSQLYTVERGITNRYWNESENGSKKTTNGKDRLGTRLGFGAHHTGLHFNSTPNPQGLEIGASIVNSAQGRFNEGAGGNSDLGMYANIVFNWKTSDFQKFAIGCNFGRTQYYSTSVTQSLVLATAANTSTGAITNTEYAATKQRGGIMTGYNPFIQVQYFGLTAMAEMLSTELTDMPTALSANDGTDAGRQYNAKPVGYDATLAYKMNDNWEAVARYTTLDTDGRGQKIADGARGFNKAIGGNSDSFYDKSDAVYVGLNYYFTLTAAGTSVAGHNAKLQVGYEMATFKDRLVSGSYNNAQSADVNTIRAQFQVGF